MEEILQFLTNPILVYSFAGTVLLLLIFSGKIKKLSIGRIINFESNVEPKTTTDTSEINSKIVDGQPSVIYNRDTKQYNLILELVVFGQHGLIEDIKKRIKKNGWSKRTNWRQYVLDAVESHHSKITRTLDDWYPVEAEVTRIELFEHNKEITQEISERLIRMYDAMYEIYMNSYKEAKELQDLLDEPNLCSGNQSGVCGGKLAAVNYMQRINELKGDRLMELCEIEAERALLEISQKMFSHYLSIYNRKLS